MRTHAAHKQTNKQTDKQVNNQNKTQTNNQRSFACAFTPTQTRDICITIYLSL